MSYSEPRRATSSPPPADLSAMACGRLERGGDAAQCVLVCLPDMSAALDVVPPYNPLYGLLTCHHVLPTVPDGTWKLILGPTARDKYQLNRSKILKLLSCCGPNGFWQSEVHVPLRGNQAAGLCPARGDWTLAILQPAFVDEIKRGPHEFFFPLITPFTPEVLKTAVQTKRCRLLERKPDGTILQHFIDINPAISQPKDGRQQLENEVCSYREMSVLRYPMTFLSTVKAGCSGAPIFCQVSSSMAADSLSSPSSSSAYTPRAQTSARHSRVAMWSSVEWPLRTYLTPPLKVAVAKACMHVISAHRPVINNSRTDY